MYTVHEFITRDDRVTENVTLWCKQVLYWERAQRYDWNIQPAFLKTLIETTIIKIEEKSAKRGKKVENKVDTLLVLIMTND